jgi:molecular chaperone GrpE (heat shock protein)
MLTNVGSSTSVVVPQTTSITIETTKNESTGALTIRMDPSAKGAAAAGGADQASSGPQESDRVKELKKQIEQLQEQLLEAQQALQRAQASKQSEEAKAVAVAAAQSQITTISAALQTVTGALLQAVMDESGSGKGSMVSTTA